MRHPPQSAGMRNDNRAHADLNIVLDLDTLGPLVIEVDVIADENLSSDYHASKAM